MTTPVQVRQIPGRWRRRRWEAECVCLRQHAVTAHPNPPTQAAYTLAA